MNPLDRYEILGFVTPSPWAKRYLASYRSLGSEVLLWELGTYIVSDEALRRIACAEIKLWAKLADSRVLPVLDWEVTGAHGYIATAVPRGVMLSELMAHGIPNGLSERIIFEIASALERARVQGVLHLCLNPFDIWVRGEGVVEIAGFCMWYLIRENHDRSQDLSPFLAPEQSAGGDVRAATDVYSLALLYASMKGGVDPASVVFRDELLACVPDGLPPVVYRCLDENPEARCVTAGEFLSELRLERKKDHFPHNWQEEDCPMCARLERLRADRRRGVSGENRFQDSICFEGLIWLMIGFLFVATVIVWWLALK